MTPGNFENLCGLIAVSVQELHEAARLCEDVRRGLRVQGIAVRMLPRHLGVAAAHHAAAMTLIRAEADSVYVGITRDDLLPGLALAAGAMAGRGALMQERVDAAATQPEALADLVGVLLIAETEMNAAMDVVRTVLGSAEAGEALAAAEAREA